MTRPPALRASFEGELVVDNFAGGGGASTGIEAALGRHVDIAINHDPVAIAMHRANHPKTKHYCESIFDVDPREACAGHPVGLLWASPDCKHHSRAKGTKPLDKNIRALAWVVVRWAEQVRPRVIFVENVVEFADWGPLDENDRPIKARKAEIFREWIGQLTALGYRVEWRALVAADYGAPTTRKRLFVIARCDDQPIAWPEPTHGDGRARPWRAAAEIIDWSIPGRSIFGRKKPLKEATLRRIAKGIERYVIGAAEPFIIPATRQRDLRVHAIGEPLRTVTAAKRGELVLVEPFVVRHGHYSTITGAGLREGCGAGTFRGQRLDDPLATVCATNDKHLVCPIITKHYGDPDRASGGGAVVGHGVERPIGTVTARDHHALSAAWLLKYYGTSHSADARDPMPTITAGGGRGGGHIAAVQAFLAQYGSVPRRAAGQLELLPSTPIDLDQLGVVWVRGEPYQIVDITTRMLQPPELFGAQGFPGDYDITTGPDGRPLTKTEQTALAGNSVSPPNAKMLVAANGYGREASAA